MCFNTTTLSQRELVSGRTDGSSSSQSASLLGPSKHCCQTANHDEFDSLVELLCLFDDLIPIFTGASFLRLIGWRILLLFVRKVCSLDSHAPSWTLYAQPEVGIVEKLYCQVD